MNTSTKPPPDPDPRGPGDQLCALLHPQGALPARPPAAPPQRLGQRLRSAVVERPPVRGGPPDRKDPLGPGGQHPDLPGAAAGGTVMLEIRLDRLCYGIMGLCIHYL